MRGLIGGAKRRYRDSQIGSSKRFFTGEVCVNGHFAERYRKSGQCVECSAQLSSARYHADPVKRLTLLRQQRGLPTPTRVAPPECECCNGRNGKMGKKQLALDHCHTTGKFRGWLCSACNTSIGKLGDDIAGLEMALAYLRRVE